MAKKVMKILGILISVLVIINIYTLNSYVVAMSDVTNNAGWWGTVSTAVDDDLDKKVEVIATVVRTVGVLTSVITLVVIGIKFMLGSVEEKANYKKTLVPWLIGAILVFGMSNIPMIIYNTTKTMFSQEEIVDGRRRNSSTKST